MSQKKKGGEKMAASNKTSAEGYKCEFVQPYTEDFVCKICKYVARECSLTTCCGETFCQACISQVLEDKKPCPSCRKQEFVTYLNPKYQQRILALEVCCTMKDRGCDWRAKLEHLEAHLDINTGECEYVDIECPNKCKQAVQKREMTKHLTNDCPKRDFYCQHCNFKATYEVVCDTHWPECKNYPVQCPNACMVGAVERGDLDDHLKQCSLQEVECEFSYAGCKERLEQQHMERHMQESTQKHLAMMSAATLRMSREFEQKLQEQREEFQGYLERKERETAELLQKKDEELEQKLREKDEKITAVQTQLQKKDKELDQKLRKKDEQIEEQFQRKDRETRQQLQRQHEEFQKKLQQNNELLQKSLAEKTELYQKKDKELDQKLRKKDEQIEEQFQRKDRETRQQLQRQHEEFQKKLQQNNELLQKSLAEKTELYQKKDKELEQKLWEKDEKITAVQTKDEENEVRIINLERQLQERGEQIEEMMRGVVLLTVPNVTCETQNKERHTHWDSPPMSTHHHGYELHIQVWYNYYYTHVGVGVYSMVGKYDDQLKWPVSCTITVQLLNQHQDKDHVTASGRLIWYRPSGRTYRGSIKSTLHPISDLGWNAQNQTQYLKDDCLKIKVTKIVIQTDSNVSLAVSLRP